MTDQNSNENIHQIDRYRDLHVPSTPEDSLADSIVLDIESRAKFLQLLADINRDLAPASPIEILLARKMAVAYWRQMRLWALQKATLAHEIDRADFDGTPLARTIVASESLAGPTRLFEQMSRHESRLDQQYARAMTCFREHHNFRNTTKGAPERA